MNRDQLNLEMQCLVALIPMRRPGWIVKMGSHPMPASLYDDTGHRRRDAQMRADATAGLSRNAMRARHFRQLNERKGRVVSSDPGEFIDA